MPDNSFPKENRLLTERDFSRVYEAGEKRAERYFVFYLLDREEAGSRIGIVTPKYLGKAVERNRIKRQIRESYRKNKDLFTGFDFVVRPRKEAVKLDNAELAEDFLNDFRRIDKVV